MAKATDRGNLIVGLLMSSQVYSRIIMIGSMQHTSSHGSGAVIEPIHDICKIEAE